jgi:hypothetical protein
LRSVGVKKTGWHFAGSNGKNGFRWKSVGGIASIWLLGEVGEVYAIACELIVRICCWWPAGFGAG